MAGLNEATLIGHVGRDPEIITTTSGADIARFSLATSESWRDKASGERKERTEWHTIVCFNENMVKVIRDHVTKGMQLCIKGQIRTRKWQDKDGNDRYSTEIHLTGFQAQLLMLGQKKGDRAPPPEDDARAQRGSGGKGAKAKGGGDDDFQRPDFDDEIPF